MLGHNDGEKNHIQPKLVEFFAKNNLKVVDVQLGEAHTIALTGIINMFIYQMTEMFGAGDMEEEYKIFLWICFFHVHK